MVQSIEDYSLYNISNRINLRRSQTSILYIRFPVFLHWGAMHHVSMYFLRKTVFRFLPREKRSCFRENNTIFTDNTRKIICRLGPFWKDHLFRASGKRKYGFPCSDLTCNNRMQFVEETQSSTSKSQQNEST